MAEQNAQVAIAQIDSSLHKFAALQYQRLSANQAGIGNPSHQGYGNEETAEARSKDGNNGN